MIACDIEEATHLSMNGGKMRIHPEFWERYLSLFKKQKMYIVERANSVKHKFFLDIDTKKVYFDLQKFIEFETTVLNKTYMICTRGSYGVHIIYQDVFYSTVDEAKNLCSMFDNFPVDYSVYHTGLRIIGSLKKNDDLALCNMYIPDSYVTNGIRTKIKHPWSLPVLLSSFIRLSDENRSVMKREYEYGYESMVAKHLEKLEQFNIKIKIKKYTERYYLVNTDSKYCLNIKDEHKSVNVYFVINVEAGTVYQKCFCRCKCRTCSTYKSKAIHLHPKVMKHIFS